MLICNKLHILIHSCSPSFRSPVNILPTELLESPNLWPNTRIEQPLLSQKSARIRPIFSASFLSLDEFTIRLSCQSRNSGRSMMLP